MAKKYYAVRNGRCPGVYKTWNECNAQVKGYSGAVYKGFDSWNEAKEFAYGTGIKTVSKTFNMPMIAYTDGSFDGGLGGWGYTLMRQDKSVILQACGPCTKTSNIRNIGGEIEAAEEAILRAIDLKADCITIFHDYEGIGRWGNEEWMANKEVTRDYVRFVKQKRSQINIFFYKVAGHSGNVYNDIADSLAERGRVSRQYQCFDADGTPLDETGMRFLAAEQAFFSGYNQRKGIGICCNV